MLDKTSQKRFDSSDGSGYDSLRVQVEKKKPIVVKYGLNHVTSLVESKKAELVIIANDVHPIEMVVWLPALCKKMGVPYCIVKDKSRYCRHPVCEPEKE